MSVSYVRRRVRSHSAATKCDPLRASSVRLRPGLGTSQGDHVVNIYRILRAVLVAVSMGTSVPAGAQAPQTAAAAAASATVDQLAWVTGAWTGKLGERTIEQHWSAPLGGSIIAMYRSIQDNRAT